MQIFRDVAGYSLGRADVVRRAISKKKAGVLESERAAFISGAAANGISEANAVKLFEDIASFANYAFNKSHAAAYAIISYRTAYLKAHAPLEYACALLTSVYNNPSKISEYLSECLRNNIGVFPPDINRSGVNFRPENGAVRYPLLALKNVGEAFARSIVSERERNGDFKSFEDFVNRTTAFDMNKRQLETLIKVGCFDSLGVHRSRLLAGYESLLEQRSAAVRASRDGQLDLFSQFDSHEVKAPEFIFPEVREFTAKEKLMLEKECAGLYLSGHILDDYSEHLSKIKTDSIADIKASFESDSPTEDEGRIARNASAKEYHDKENVTVAGVISKRTNKQTRSGDAMAFIVVEDAGGEIELVVFPKTLDRYDHLLRYESVILASATVSLKDDEIKLILQNAYELAENGSPIPQIPQSSARSGKEAPSSQVKENPHTAASSGNSPYVQNNNPADVTKIFLKIDRYGGPLFERAKALVDIFSGNVPVVFYDSQSGKYIQSDACRGAATPFLIKELKELLGDENVVLKR